MVNHWADKVVEEVKRKVEHDPLLKEVVKKTGYYVYDEKTPSGKIHIGSGRGWIISDVIAKALRDAGLDAKFVLSSDDHDPYDKSNKELPKSWDKYLGMSFRDIPSPVEGHKSFGAYYFSLVTDKFKDYGIECELESTGEEYEKGVFNDAIKIVLDNVDKIKKIYSDMYGEDSTGANRYPFNIKCEKCGKIATTNIIGWDGKKVEYECGDVVKWAKGCGHKGKRSPYDGNGKMPWKIEWPAKWFAKKVIIEYAGKDHFSAMGARDFGVKLCNEVFDFTPPYPSTRKKTGKGYEFFHVGGKKMSTSKGFGVGFAEITEKIPAKILRYLLIRSRPHSVIDFDPFKDNDLILLFDRYDRMERIYFGKERVSEEEENKQKRMYELAYVGKIPKKMPVQVQFSHAAITIQLALTEEKAIEILQGEEHVPKKINKEEEEQVKERLRSAKNWVETFASDNYKFQLVEKVPWKLNKKEREVVDKVLSKIDNKITDKELHEEIYKICKESEYEPRDFFSLFYKMLIGKEKGPRLASFLLTIGEDRLRKILS
jgi:lysyl-tRNA synthetase, class I